MTKNPETVHSEIDAERDRDAASLGKSWKQMKLCEHGDAHCDIDKETEWCGCEKSCEAFEGPLPLKHEPTAQAVIQGGSEEKANHTRNEGLVRES